MDYEKQLKKFCSMLNCNPLSSNAVSIYLILLDIARELNWINKFTIANITLISRFTNMTIKQLQNARNELIVNNFIEYQKR